MDPGAAGKYDHLPWRPAPALRHPGQFPYAVQDLLGCFGNRASKARLQYDWPVVIITVIGACGALVAALRKRIPAEALLLIISAIASMIAFVSWTRMYAVTDNSRLIMPVTATGFDLPFGRPFELGPLSYAHPLCLWV